MYLLASRRIQGGAPSAIVIDDVDTTVGEWEHNTGTVNHQQVLAELMHLADNPNSIEQVHEILPRVPIFVTGNDFGKLYPPLRRPGRMFPFYWRATIDERIDMLVSMLGVEYKSVAREMVLNFPGRPISFFAQVAQEAQLQLTQPMLAQLHTRLRDVVLDPTRHRAYLSPAGVDERVYRQALLESAARLAAAGESMSRSWLSNAEDSPPSSRYEIGERDWTIGASQ
mgnify:FL=1